MVEEYGEQPIQSNQLSPSVEDTSQGTVTIRKVKYAVGLIWQPLQDPDNPTPEIREAMETDTDSDLYCLRITSTPQYGLAKTSLGHRSGELSLAAMVASALSDKTSICGVFKVEEGWYFLAVRNDLILSENDVLFKTEQEAEDAFYSMMAVPDWDLKIVPAEWKIEGTVSRTIESIVRDARTKVRLEELGAKKRNQVLLFIGIILVVAFVLIFYSMLTVFTPVIQTEEKIEPIPIPEIIRPVEPTPEKPKPWEKIPETRAFLNKCWNNAYQLKALNIPGWSLGIISCSNTALVTSWSRGDTRIWKNQPRIAWIKSALNEYKLTNVNLKINSDGASANGQVVFYDIPLVASVPIYTEQQLWEELTDIKQAAQLNLTFQRHTVLDPPNNPDGSKPDHQQEYVFFVFSITSPFTPFEWMTFFEKFPGLELTRIEFNPSSDTKDQNKWKYNGRIYAK
ncbi:MAG: type 4b pilus protein PilO2 [Alphaproteobacteria bacterium]|nr:type 4b pilus protein PilO2 [Alphaproteobacteria bacterium]